MLKRGRLMTDRHSASGKVFDRKQVVCPVTDGSSCQSQSAFKGKTTQTSKKEKKRKRRKRSKKKERKKGKKNAKSKKTERAKEKLKKTEEVEKIFPFSIKKDMEYIHVIHNHRVNAKVKTKHSQYHNRRSTYAHLKLS